MVIHTISPQIAKDLIEKGALLVDIRSIKEYQSEHILDAVNLPINQFDSNILVNENASKIIFYCRSGMRTKLNSDKFSFIVGKELFILQGGINAWKKMQLPTIKGAKQPMEITRQLHIIISSLIILGSILGFTLSSWFYLLPFILGCGLFVSGITGFCAMECLLTRMPWNHVKCNR